MKVYDISQEVFSCVVFGKDPAPKKTVLASIKDGSPYNLIEFSMWAHNGTHLDAPSHFVGDGKTIEQLSPDRLVGYAYVAEHTGEVTEDDIKAGYEVFKTEKFAKELIVIADTHQLSVATLQSFVNTIVERKIFDGEKLSELVAPLELGWKDRTKKETEIMTNLVPLLKRMAGGQKISGLSAYEDK